jgi:hypothetical protein
MTNGLLVGDSCWSNACGCGQLLCVESRSVAEIGKDILEENGNALQHLIIKC